MIDSDEQLIELWKTAADQKALAELALRYLPQFYRTARAMMQSHLHAEDIAQEVMLKVIRSLASFRGDTGFRVWSYTILLNTIRSELKKANRWRKIDDLVDSRLSEDSEKTSPYQNVIDRESQKQFELAISKLTDSQRMALVLMHVDGLPAKDIAYLQGCSVDAVYQRVSEAKRRLRTDPALRALWLERN